MEAHQDKFGVRQYYFYNLGLITELAGKSFEVAHMRREVRPNANHEAWIEIILRKL